MEEEVSSLKPPPSKGEGERELNLGGKFLNTSDIGRGLPRALRMALLRVYEKRIVDPRDNEVIGTSYKLSEPHRHELSRLADPDYRRGGGKHPLLGDSLRLFMLYEKQRKLEEQWKEEEARQARIREGQIRRDNNPTEGKG